MLKFRAIDREAFDVRSSYDHRFRVDAYFVAFDCPPDAVNPGPFPHEWICRFEVKRGQRFDIPQQIKDKETARTMARTI